MIKGLDHLKKRLEQMENISVAQPVGKATSYVQAAAKAGCSVESGELRENIFISVEEKAGNVTGICFTEKRYAPFVEFGTGPKGQKQHIGISPNVAVAYTQSPWWIHESQIDKKLAERYHWFYIDTEDGRFYQCSGQPARPFMYPALKDNEQHVTEMIKNDIRRQMK